MKGRLIISLLNFTPADQLTSHNDAHFSKRHLSANLGIFIPPRFVQSWGDELDTVVVFAELNLVNQR
jgi:hypothetical protein